jgi:hypothetical protein
MTAHLESSVVASFSFSIVYFGTVSEASLFRYWASSVYWLVLLREKTLGMEAKLACINQNRRIGLRGKPH